MTEDQQNTTPPIDHEKVNAWMLGNGWEWQTVDNNYGGFWKKEGFSDVTQDLAAEMWRMSEARAREAERRGYNTGYQKRKRIGKRAQNVAHQLRIIADQLDQDEAIELAHQPKETKQ